MDREEAMQEAKYLFLKCRRRYPSLTDQEHFMALYKTSLNNYFNLASNKRTERRQYEVDMEEGDSVGTLTQLTEYNSGYAWHLLEQAPEEIRAVLHLLSEAPKELLQEVAGAWKAQGKRKAEGNKHLCMLLGFPEQDIIGSVQDYFSNPNEED